MHSVECRVLSAHRAQLHLDVLNRRPAVQQAAGAPEAARGPAAGCRWKYGGARRGRSRRGRGAGLAENAAEARHGAWRATGGGVGKGRGRVGSGDGHDSGGLCLCLQQPSSFPYVDLRSTKT